MSLRPSKMPAPVGAPVAVCSAFALFRVAHTNARTPASAVNQTIFFLSTVKSSIPQKRIGNVRLAPEDCQFGLALALGPNSLAPFDFSLRLYFPFRASRVIFA